MGFIYIIQFKNGKSYVGQTVYSTYKRWSEHLSEAKRDNDKGCRLLNKALRKYYPNTDIDLEILLECNDKHLNDYETKFIKTYGTLVPGGYNLTEGGSAGKKSEETKQRMSEAAQNRDNSVYKQSDATRDLPTYIYINGDYYVVRYHPNMNGAKRVFNSLEHAKHLLNELNNGLIIHKSRVVGLRSKYIRKESRGGINPKTGNDTRRAGYRCTYPSLIDGTSNRYFLEYLYNFTDTTDQDLLAKAEQYLAELIEYENTVKAQDKTTTKEDKIEVKKPKNKTTTDKILDIQNDIKLLKEEITNHFKQQEEKNNEIISLLNNIIKFRD